MKFCVGKGVAKKYAAARKNDLSNCLVFTIYLRFLVVLVAKNCWIGVHCSMSHIFKLKSFIDLIHCSSYDDVNVRST